MRYAVAVIPLTWAMALPLAIAQQPGSAPPVVVNRPYDGLTAGAEAYLNGEAQRRQNIARQLGHVDQLTWSLGLPNRTDGVVWYRDPPSLEAWYAYGRPATALYSRRIVGATTDVSEPWPRVPGDIFGYPDPAPIRQPVGHISTQTGPNRWEYHPIYAEDLAPAQAPIALRVQQAGVMPAVGANQIPPPPQPAADVPGVPQPNKGVVAPTGPRAF